MDGRLLQGTPSFTAGWRSAFPARLAALSGGIPGHVRGELAQDGLHLEVGQAGMLAQDAGDDPGYMRCREAIAGRGDPAPLAPGDSHVNPGRTELYGRLGVVVEHVRILALVRCDRDHRGIHRGEAGDR